MGWRKWAAWYPMSNKLKWPHSLFSLSIFSSVVPSLRLFLSFFLFLLPSILPPSLTSLANCEAVVQHARQPASQRVGLSPIIHNHNRQKGYMQTTDRIALKLRAEESGRQSHWQWVGEQAKKERKRSSQRKGDRGKSCAMRLLAGYHRPYEARAGWERLLLLWASTCECTAKPPLPFLSPSHKPP